MQQTTFRVLQLAANKCCATNLIPPKYCIHCAFGLHAGVVSLEYSTTRPVAAFWLDPSSSPHPDKVSPLLLHANQHNYAASLLDDNCLYAYGCQQLRLPSCTTLHFTNPGLLKCTLTESGNPRLHHHVSVLHPFQRCFAPHWRSTQLSSLERRVSVAQVCIRCA